MRVPLLRPLAAGLIAAAMLVPAASAATSGEITLTVDGFGGSETFVSSGGFFCPSGTAESFDFMFAGGGRAGTFHLKKTFTCDDNSGSLTIYLSAATANGSPQDQGGWKVVSGTGDYAGIKGGGNLVGDYVGGGVIDHYVGVLTR